MRLFRMAIIALLSVGGLATAHAEDTVKYGLGVSLTGPLGFAGNQYTKGVQTAFDYVNSEGGINGKKLEVIIRDIKGLPNEAVLAAKRLIDLDKVRVLDISLPGTATLATMPLSKEAKIPMLGFTSIPNAVDQGNPYFFRPYPNINLFAAALAKVVTGFSTPRKLALLASNDDYGRSVVGVMAKSIGGQPNVEVVFEDYYDRTQTDFSAIFLRMKAAGADTFYLDVRYPQSVTALKQMAEVGLTGTVLTSSFYNNELATRVGNLLEGVYISVPWAPVKQDAESKKFVELYRKLHKDEVPDDFAAAGWVSAVVAADALRRAAPDATGDQLRESFMKTDIDSPMGRIKFNAKGDAELPALLLKFEGGAYKPQ